MTRLARLQDLASLRKKLADRRTAGQRSLRVCGGTGCQASHATGLVERLKKELARHKLARKVPVRVTGCLGFCEQGPIVVVEPANTFYCRVKPEDAAEIVSRTVRSGEVVERLLYTDPLTQATVLTESEIPFFRG